MELAGATVIETDRLVLRPLGVADVDALHELMLVEPVRRYLCDGELLPRAVVEGWRIASDALFQRVGVGLWCVRERGAAPLVGLTGYAEFFEPPVLELLFALAPSRWGRGYAVEMASAAIEQGFTRGGMETIRASTDEPNAASIRVMERLELTPAGEDPGPTWRQLHFELTRARWRARATAS